MLFRHLACKPGVLQSPLSLLLLLAMQESEELLEVRREIKTTEHYRSRLLVHPRDTTQWRFKCTFTSLIAELHPSLS